MWISEVWAAFDRSILARSFDQCGITSPHLEDMHLQLRTFVSTAQFLDTVVDAPLDRDIETLFAPPRDGDAQDESFRMDEEDDDEDDETRIKNSHFFNKIIINNVIFINIFKIN